MEFKKYHFNETKEFDVNLITIDPVIRDICKQNVCGHYGNNHMCPPEIKDIDEWKKIIFSYKKAIIVTKVYPTQNSYDTDAWIMGLKDFQQTLLKLKEDNIKSISEKSALLLGAGACYLCEKCTYPDAEPCRFPEKAFPSLEACGIDVMTLSRRVGVKYNNGDNTITYIGAILY